MTADPCTKAVKATRVDLLIHEAAHAVMAWQLRAPIYVVHFDWRTSRGWMAYSTAGDRVARFLHMVRVPSSDGWLAYRRREAKGKRILVEDDAARISFERQVEAIWRLDEAEAG